MRLRLPTALAVLFVALPLCAQDKHLLRYDLKPGSVWVELTQEMTQDMSVGGRDTQTHMTTTMLMEGKTTAVKDGVAAVDQRYARIKLKSDSPLLKVDYDSDVPDSKPGQFRNLADLVGKSAQMKIDSQGKILEFTMPAEVDEMLGKLGASLKQGMEQQFVAFPKDPVAIGESWQTSLEMPMEGLGTTKVTVTNKLLAVADGTVTVEQSMTMDTSGLKSASGLTMEMPKAGGVTKLGLNSFLPIASTMDMQMTMKMGDGGDKAMNMNMAMHMVMKQVAAPAPKPAEAKPADAPKK